MSPRRGPRPMKYTYELVCVGLALAAGPLDEHWTYDLAKRAGLLPATASGVTSRMRTFHWLIAVRTQPGKAGQPRLLLRVTTKGIEELRKICAFADGKSLYAQRMPPHGALDVSPCDVPAPRQEAVIDSPGPHAFVIVGLAIASRPHDEHWALGLAVRTNLKRETVARALSRMTADGWLTDRRQTNRRGCGRPRRLYTVTPPGVAGLRELCEHAKDDPEYREWMAEVFQDAPDEGPDDDQDDGPDNAAIPRQDRMYFDSFPRLPMPELPRGVCQECGAERALRDDGTMPDHSTEPGVRCDGSKRLPGHGNVQTTVAAVQVHGEEGTP